MYLPGTEQGADEPSEDLPLDSENTFRDFSSTENGHALSGETFDFAEDSSLSLPCMSSIRECEEYFEASMSNNVKGSFSDFLSSCGSHATEHGSSRISSDDSSKRHKISTSQSFTAGTEETVCDNSLCTGHEAFAGVDNAISKHMETGDQRTKCESVEDEALPSLSWDRSNLMNFDGLPKQQIKQLQCKPRCICGSIDEKQMACNASYHNTKDKTDVDSQENAKNVASDALMSIDCMGYYKMHESLECYPRTSYWNESQDYISNQVDSGFVTGNNKKIFVDPSKITLVDEDVDSNGSKAQTGLPAIPDDSTKLDIHKRDSCFSMPSECTSIPVCHEQASKDDEPDSRMMDIFRNVRKHFKSQEHRWVLEQFKWAWLHLFSTQTQESGCLETEIIDIMNLRLKNEHSVLRRIVEFDDAPFKFMVLGVIRIEKDSVELYDGFYSLKFEMDEHVYTMLKMEHCDIGSRLYVFGCDILLKSPTSIFDVEGNALRLHYNSIRVCNDTVRLGAMRKASFLNNISRLILDGGVVSAIVVKIKRIIELKYFVAVENYRNRVDDLEREMEKIHEIARKVDYTIDPKDVVVRRFCKMVVEDESGECILTWWSPPELKIAETYKFIYLIPVRNTSSLHLSTNRKTYFEKIG